MSKKVSAVIFFLSIYEQRYMQNLIYSNCIALNRSENNNLFQKQTFILEIFNTINLDFKHLKPIRR